MTVKYVILPPVILQGSINLKPGPLILAFVVLFTTSCALFRSEIGSVSDMLPRDTDLSGWMRTSDPAEYSGTGIRNYREDYHRTGIERISICIYKTIDDEKNSYTVELMKFNNTLNSYGFFSRIAGGTEFSSDTENEFYGTHKAVALRGEYIVYTFTESDNEDSDAVLRSFIRASLKYIGTAYTRDNPDERINILKYRDNYGIIYSINPVAEQEGIDSIYYTQWRHNKALIKVFISERVSFTDSYRLFNERIKKGYIIAESGTIYKAFRRNIDGTFSFISINDKWVYGCWSSPDIETGKKITEELRLRISDYNPR